MKKTLTLLLALGSIALGGEVAVTIGGNVITASGVVIGSSSNTGSAITSSAQTGAVFSTMDSIVTTDLTWYANTNNSNVGGISKVGNAATIVTDGPSDPRTSWAAFSYTLSSAVLGQIVENTAITLSFDLYVSGGNNKNTSQGVAITLLSSQGNSETFTYNNTSGTGTPAAQPVLTLDANTVNALRTAGGDQKLIFFFKDTAVTGGTNEAWTMKDMALTYTTGTSAYTWAATDPSDWTATVWKTSPDGALVAYTPNSDAVFDDTATSTQVNITSDISAMSVTVSDNAYTFTLSEDATLTAQSLTVESGLSITGSGTVHVNGALTQEGTLSLASGVSMTAGSGIADASGKFALTGDGHLTLTSLNMGDAATQTLEVSDSATLTVSGTSEVGSGKTLSIEGEGLVDLTTLKSTGGTINVTADLNVTGGGTGQSGDNQKALAITGGSGTVNINDGTTTVTGAVYSGGGSTGTLNVGTQSGVAKLVATRLEFGDTNSGGSVSRINIGANGTVVVTSANNDPDVKKAGLAVAEWNQNTEISVDGKLYAQSTRIFAHDGLMTLTIQGGGVVAVKGITADKAQNNVVTLAEGGKLVLGDTGITSGQGTWNISLNGGEVGITANTTIARAINVAGAVTFNTAKYTWSDEGQTLTQGDDAGTITVSGNITGAGTITKTGTGELILSGTGNALTHTLQIKEGQLTLNGSIAIDGIKDGELEEGFVNASDEKTPHGNGFAYKAGTMNVYSLEGDAQFVNNGSFTINGETVAVTEEGKYVLSETVDKTTLYVNENSANFAAYKEKAVDELSKVVLAAGTSVNMDYDAASITLEMRGNATVNATAATTISGVEGWSNNTLTIIGEDTVTLSGGDLTLAGTQKLDVRGSVASGTISVSEAGAGLSVAEDATLAVTGRLNAKHGDVTINGALTLTDALDLGCDGQSDVVLTIGSTGSVTANSIMYMNTAASVKMLAGGEFSIGGLTFTGKVDDGTITATARGQYSTNRAENKITNATVTVTGAVTLGNTLEGVDVVVAGGGTLTLSDTAEADSVTVEDGGTIAGGVDAKDVGIVAQGTATFDEGIHEAGIDIEGWVSGATVKNTGATTAKYTGLQDSNMKVAADTLYALNEEAVVVDNALEVGIIMHDGTAALTLTQVDAEVLSGVYANDGVLALQNITAVGLTEMSIASGTTVAVYQGTEDVAAQEGTVTITDTLTAGGGTLLANLEMADGSTLDLSLMEGGIQALTLGSQFTIDDGALVKLDVATLAAIAGLENIGDKVILIQQYEDHALTTNLVDGDWSRTHFDLSSITGADYQLYVTGTEIGLVKSSMVPEPTTGTLSLLALAALAARRRKH